MKSEVNKKKLFMNFHSHRAVQDELKCVQKKRNIFEKKKFKRHKKLYKKN